MVNRNIELNFKDFLKLGDVLLLEDTNNDIDLYIDKMKEEFYLHLEEMRLNSLVVDQQINEQVQEIDKNIENLNKVLKKQNKKILIGSGMLLLGLLGVDITLTNLIIKMINKN